MHGMGIHYLESRDARGSYCWVRREKYRERRGQRCVRVLLFPWLLCIQCTRRVRLQQHPWMKLRVDHSCFEVSLQSWCHLLFDTCYYWTRLSRWDCWLLLCRENLWKWRSFEWLVRKGWQWRPCWWLLLFLCMLRRGPTLNMTVSTNSQENDEKSYSDEDKDGLWWICKVVVEGGGLICEGILEDDGCHGEEVIGDLISDIDAIDDADCDLPDNGCNDEEFGVSVHGYLWDCYCYFIQILS